MVNFESITPANVALAMAADTPAEAVIAMRYNLGEFKPEYSIDSTDATWRATSLSVRHGLLMEWLAAEIVEAGGL